MGFIKNIIAKATSAGASDIITSVGEVADRFINTSEDKQKFQLEMGKVVNERMKDMQEYQARELEAQVKEMESARSREVQIATAEKAPLLNKIITPILAILVIVLAFSMFYMVMFKKLEGADRDVVVFVLGVLSSAVTMILGYYFGSSAGSARKQQYIEATK